MSIILDVKLVDPQSHHPNVRADQHRLEDANADDRRPLGARAAHVRAGTEAHSVADGEGLLPALPPLRALPDAQVPYQSPSSPTKTYDYPTPSLPHPYDLPSASALFNLHGIPS